MKIAIVTGATSGIGKAVALALAARGTGVILTYRSRPEAGAEISRQIEAAGGHAAALALDLCQPETFGAFTERVRKTLGLWKRETFDSLINNSGVGGGMPFAEITPAYFDSILQTNFRGPFFLTQALLPLLEDGGRVVNTSSGSRSMSALGFSAYGPSKAALSSWTKYLAKELAPRKITVNAVSPGPVLTNLADGAFDKHPEYVQPLADQTAFGRIGQPEDIAKVMVKLLEDDFGWMTAQDIDVSGGFLL